MTTSHPYTKKVLCRSFGGKLKKKKRKGVGVASPQRSTRERSGQSLSFSTPLSKEQHEDVCSASKHCQLYQLQLVN